MEWKNVTYILENIISKAKYNEETHKYELKESDYIDLNLSTNKLKLLKKICEKLGIELEYKGYNRMLLPCVENEELFQAYNDIKNKLEQNPNSPELETRRIEIRNKIIIDNLEFVKSIIDRRLDGINDLEDKEDIYQIGYEILLKYIDNNYLYKETFKENISRRLMISMFRKLSLETEGISNYKKKQVSCLIDTQESSNKEEPEELSKQLNLKRNKIEELLALENILTAISLEEEIDNINIQEINDDSPLYDDTFETRMINLYSYKEIISKILSTLPKDQQNILTLYFGLKDGISYNMSEIATMYGFTKAGISVIINKAIRTIQTSIRIKYLKEIYEVPDTYEHIGYNSGKELEEFLVRNLPKELADISYKELESIDEVKFFSIFYQHPELEIKEIAKILNYSTTYTYRIKNKTITSIRKTIMTELSKEQNKNLTYEEYLDYLMNLYLCKGKVKKR